MSVAYEYAQSLLASVRVNDLLEIRTEQAVYRLKVTTIVERPLPNDATKTTRQITMRIVEVWWHETSNNLLSLVDLLGEFWSHVRVARTGDPLIADLVFDTHLNRRASILVTPQTLRKR